MCMILWWCMCLSRAKKQAKPRIRQFRSWSDLRLLFRSWSDLRLLSCCIVQPFNFQVEPEKLKVDVSKIKCPVVKSILKYVLSCFLDSGCNMCVLGQSWAFCRGTRLARRRRRPKCNLVLGKVVGMWNERFQRTSWRSWVVPQQAFIFILRTAFWLSMAWPDRFTAAQSGFVWWKAWTTSTQSQCYPCFHGELFAKCLFCFTKANNTHII